MMAPRLPAIALNMPPAPPLVAAAPAGDAQQPTRKPWLDFWPKVKEFVPAKAAQGPAPRVPTMPGTIRPPAVIAAGQQRPVVVNAGGNERAQPAAQPYAEPKKQLVQIVNNTYLDGRLIAKNVVERAVQEMSRPAAGLSAVDTRMSFMSPSMAR